MTKKMTKKEMFTMVANVVENAEVESKTEMLEFLAHEVELLERKSGKSGQTKTQKENEVLVEQVFNALAELGKPVTVSEFMKESTHEVATLSNQKLSALFKKLVEAERVVKTTEKKKSYFSVAQSKRWGICPTQKGSDDMSEKEKQILLYMKQLDISREEAEQLWEDDQEDYIGEAGEEMTKKAKEIKRYETSEKTKSKSKKERKIDETKKEILCIVHKALESIVKITEVKTETEIKFVYNDENYTLKLTKHRKGKQSIDRLHKMQSVFLLHFTIDNWAEMWYNGRPALDCDLRAWADLPVNWYSAQILIQLFVHFFNKNFPKMLDFCVGVQYYNIRRSGEVPQEAK